MLSWIAINEAIYTMMPIPSAIQHEFPNKKKWRHPYFTKWTSLFHGLALLSSCKPFLTPALYAIMSSPFDHTRALTSPEIWSIYISYGYFVYDTIIVFRRKPLDKTMIAHHFCMLVAYFYILHQ
jgi:hypothetical protein